MEPETQALPAIPGYEARALLGSGGMARVYLALQESLARPVALKLMHPSLSTDPLFRERFLHEGRLVAAMAHPHIISVYDSGEHQGIHYLVMAHLPGGTLAQRMGRGLAPAQALPIIRSLTDALAYAHEQGIVHRDIKPSNVLFSEGDAPVLTDFGIATTVQSSAHLTATGMTLGSIEYMSPEQAAGDRVDERADLYSLGVLLWQLLTGRLPYEGPNALALARRHLEDPVPRLPPELSRYQGLIDALLAKAPQDRPTSARVLHALLTELTTELSPDAGHRGADQRTRRLTQVPASAPIAAKAPPVQTHATQDRASDHAAPDPPTRLSAATTALAAAAALLLVVSYTALSTGP